MAINWAKVLENGIPILILALLGGVVTLAFSDWKMYREVMKRALIAITVSGAVAFGVYLQWTDSNDNAIWDEVTLLLEQGGIENEFIQQKYELNQRLRGYVYWVGGAVAAVWLLFSVVSLFARPPVKKKLAQRRSNARKEGLAKTEQPTLEQVEPGDTDDDIES
jgi:4-amino-4-deoxy-L-arabinose transferase-like glycosyltransferase